MPNIRVVTDSSALFVTAQQIHHYGVSVVPNHIIIADRAYREGTDLTDEQALQLIASAAPQIPKIRSPSTEEFAAVYRQLAADCDAIISIHPSRHLYTSWQNACRAAEQIGGHPEIFVVDSQNLSAGLGMLVHLAAIAAERDDNIESIVRYVRGAVERIFSVYYVETVDFLFQNKIMSPSHSILGAMLGVKPVLSIENGILTPMEKVRTRLQAVERLVEFVVEFTDIDEILILQSRPQLTEQTRMMQDRLAVEFPDRQFPYALYGPSLAALLGINATGIAILESDTGSFDDEF